MNFFQLFARLAVKMEAGAPDLISAFVPPDLKGLDASLTLMNVLWGPVCTNALKTQPVSTNQDGKAAFTFLECSL